MSMTAKAQTTDDSDIVRLCSPDGPVILYSYWFLLLWLPTFYLNSHLIRDHLT